VGGSGDYCPESKHVARRGDLEDEGFTVGRGARELYLTTADDGDVVTGVALVKEDGPLWDSPSQADGIKISKFLGRKITEGALLPKLATYTIGRTILLARVGHGSSVVL
jgi:hypothetical protein